MWNLEFLHRLLTNRWISIHYKFFFALFPSSCFFLLLRQLLIVNFIFRSCFFPFPILFPGALFVPIVRMEKRKPSVKRNSGSNAEFDPVASWRGQIHTRDFSSARETLICGLRHSSFSLSGRQIPSKCTLILLAFDTCVCAMGEPFWSCSNALWSGSRNNVWSICICSTCKSDNTWYCAFVPEFSIIHTHFDQFRFFPFFINSLLLTRVFVFRWMVNRIFHALVSSFSDIWKQKQ